MNLKDTLEYRNVWLGFAMLWIVLYHMDIQIPVMLFAYFKEMGYGGVDICLFASGIGCYYSLQKNTDIIEFFSRRIRKLVPTYWCCIVVWFICEKIMGKFEVSALLGNVLGIQKLTGQGKEFNWYISALVIFYLVAPTLKVIVDRLTKKWQYIAVLVILLLISLTFWDADNFIIIVTRFSIFYLGMVSAKLCVHEQIISKCQVALIMICMVLGASIYFIFREYCVDYLWKFGLYWYPFILITPGICLILAMFFGMCGKYQWCQLLKNILGKIGEYSFEVYLVHILVFDLTKYLIEIEYVNNTNNLWYISCLVVIGGCVALRNVVGCIRAIVKKVDTIN